MRNNKQTMKGSQMKKTNNNITFENVPEWTYWKNSNTGTILTLGVFREHGVNRNHLNMDTCNTSNVLTYYYTWDEIVEKFEYLGSSESVSDDFYSNYLSNKRLYREYKLAKSRLPYLRRALKREPNAGHDVNLERMLSYVEKYNNLETFKYEWEVA
jgi:hypothetical protein